MRDALSETAIVRAVADQAAKRIARKVIAALQKNTDTTSGDGSGLKTAWDEICVQVQYEESFLWDAYDETVRSFLGAYLAACVTYLLGVFFNDCIELAREIASL